MDAKFKVGDKVKFKTEMFTKSVVWDKYRTATTVITEVHFGNYELDNKKSYRYSVALDDEPENVWHPSYFELIPPTPKHRRIRL